MNDDSDKENQNEFSDTTPHQTLKKFHKSKSVLLKEKSKYIPQILLNFNISEKNKKLEEMLSDLEIFRKQYKEILKKNTTDTEKDNSTNSINLLIYNSLEKNLIEISCINNKDTRENRLNSLYLWYKERNKINEDLRRINIKSYKEVDEISEEELMKDNNEEEKIDENEKNKKIIFKKINPRNEELINRKMIDEYQRKIIMTNTINLKRNKLKAKKENKDEETSEKNTENTLMAKTVSVIPTQDFWSGDFSTFYSYKHGTNLASLRKSRNIANENNYIDQAKGGDYENNFFPNYNKETGIYFPPLNRETKFSYSYNRPPYDYTTMLIESKIKDNKLKLLSEKREQEEIKEHLDKFGVKRAKYKEEMNNKYELRSVINMYVNSNEFNSPLLEKYKIKNNSLKKNKSVGNMNNNINFYQTMNQPSTKLAIGVSALSEKELDNKFKDNKQSNRTLEDFEKIVNDGKIEAILPMKENENKEEKSPKKIGKKMGRSASVIIPPNKKLFAEKIKVNEVKNIDNNSKNLLEQNKINKIKIKIKLPKEKIQTHLINTMQNKSEKIPSDTIGKLLSNNTLFKQRQTFENLCHINMNTKLQEKTTDNKSLYSISKDEDEDSTYHNFCLSMYDPGNLKKIDETRTTINKYYGYNNLNRNNLKDSKIHFNELHRTFHLFKDNLLNLRRTMSDWKTNEYKNLVDKIRKNKKGIKEKDEKDMGRNNSYGFKNIRMRKQNSLLNAMINPKDEFRYSQYFLPRTGSMLLSRKEDPKANKKKK